jgi:flagellar protein FliO/FliZ
MNTFLLSATGLLLSGFATQCIAVEEVKTETAKTLSTSPVPSGALLETATGLVLILALIFGLAWLIRRTGKFQANANGEIKMIASLSLGTRERAVLLEVSGERLLVGVTTQQVQTLHVLGQQQPTQENDKYGKFDQQLQSMIQKEQAND